MSWPGLFVLIEPLASPGPALLSPEEAQAHLETHLAWEERRLLRHCYWALGLQVMGGIATLVTGWLACLIGSTVVAVALLAMEKRRWNHRRLPAWLVQGLKQWLEEQPDPEHALMALRATEGGLEWHQLVNQATWRRKANST